MNKEMNALILSGKKGAGKDTLAPILVDRITDRPSVHMSFADPLKDLVDRYIAVARSSASVAEAAANFTTIEDSVPAEVRNEMARILFVASQDPAEHSRSHSPAAVRALQYYGTDFRRSQDPDYWVKQAAERIANAVADGKFPYFTDARFPNEVSFFEKEALTVRLTVSPKEQLRRLRERDGYEPSLEELQHPSETALDDYDRFDIIVNTDNGVQHTLNLVGNYLKVA